MRELLRKEGIRLFDFTQAEAYTRRLGYLNKLVLPRGGIDFGRDIPDHDVRLLAPDGRAHCKQKTFIRPCPICSCRRRRK